MNKIFIFLLIYFLPYTLMSQENIGFRGHNWYKSVDDVIKIEGEINRTTGGENMYFNVLGWIQFSYPNKYVSGYLSVSTTFYFLNNKLANGGYLIIPKPSTVVEALIIYSDLIEKINEIYGKFNYTEEIKDINENPNIKDLTRPLLSGFNSFETIWYYSGTKNEHINLHLYYMDERDKWNVSLTYYSPTYRNDLAELQRSNQRGGL
jgi:hypothetical protein